MAPEPTNPQKIAIFGATGRTGRETLKSLLASKRGPFQISAYVRSRQKLLSLIPQLDTKHSSSSSNNSNGSNGNDIPNHHNETTVDIIEGQITDLPRVQSFLASSGAATIIVTLGENDNKPSVRVLQDASRTIVAALKRLREEEKKKKQKKKKTQQGVVVVGGGGGDGDIDDDGDGSRWEAPRLLLLSSASWNDRFGPPPRVRWFAKRAFYYPYADLLKAHDTFQAAEEEEEGLISLLLVQPPAIIEEEASGYEISVEEVGIAVSYADLGAAFAELATEEAYRSVKAVGVTSGLAREGFSRYAREIVYRVVRGFLASYVPGFWTINGAVNGLLGWS